jgi:hypothetical protein
VIRSCLSFSIGSHFALNVTKPSLCHIFHTCPIYNRADKPLHVLCKEHSQSYLRRIFAPSAELLKAVSMGDSKMLSRQHVPILVALPWRAKTEALSLMPKLGVGVHLMCLSYVRGSHVQACTGSNLSDCAKTLAKRAS